MFMLPAKASWEPVPFRKFSAARVEWRLGLPGVTLPFARPAEPPTYGLALRLATSLRLGRLALFIMGLEVGELLWKALPM